MKGFTVQRTPQRLLSLFLLVPLLALVASCGDDQSSDSSAGDTSNDADVSFATDMLAHHAQAIEMADMAVDKAQDPDVVELATSVKEAQQPEIETMSGWLEAWDEPVPDVGEGSMSGMDHGSMGDDMPGMMTSEEMQRLDDASGEQFEQLWLEMMIEHHTGAVQMAEAELGNGESTDAKELAQTIIDAQEAEISTMERLLGNYSN